MKNAAIFRLCGKCKNSKWIYRVERLPILKECLASQIPNKDCKHFTPVNRTAAKIIDETYFKYTSRGKIQ